MTTIRISVLIDTTKDIDNLDDIKGDLLTIVGRMALKNPDKFLLKELDQDDESNFEEIEEHDPRITIFDNSKGGDE
jgi:hypothetical protein